MNTFKRRQRRDVKMQDPVLCTGREEKKEKELRGSLKSIHHIISITSLEFWDSRDQLLA